MSEIFPSAVYLLCFATSTACALLLVRNYLRTRARLLLWSAACFLLLAANNLVVVIDMLVMPEVNFSLLRIILALGAVGILLFGFIWDLESD
jgi:predicted membrane channel-forming protein YqfA (hemolysin III family)